MDENELIKILKDRKIKGAVLDVTRNEPLELSNPLWKCPNLILTQHTAGGSRKEILNKALSDDLSFRNSFLEGVFTVPGDGCINYKPLIKTLYNNKYTNWLVVEAEQDPIKANPLEYAKIGFNYLSKTLTEVGYNI